MTNSENDNNDEPDYNQLPQEMFKQVNYTFVYGMPNSFSNVLKRDANLSGDIADDLQILVANWLDFMAQMGFDMSLVSDIVGDMAEDNDVMYGEDADDEMSENPFSGESEEEGLDTIEKAAKHMEGDNPQNLLHIGEKSYEDIEDIVSDTEAFDNFLKQVCKEDNYVFQKIVFRAFLKDTVGGMIGDK